jgi:hypothetical protein
VVATSLFAFPVERNLVGSCGVCRFDGWRGRSGDVAETGKAVDMIHFLKFLNLLYINLSESVRVRITIKLRPLLQHVQQIEKVQASRFDKSGKMNRSPCNSAMTVRCPLLPIRGCEGEQASEIVYDRVESSCALFVLCGGDLMPVLPPQGDGQSGIVMFLSVRLMRHVDD